MKCLLHSNFSQLLYNGVIWGFHCSVHLTLSVQYNHNHNKILIVTIKTFKFGETCGASPLYQKWLIKFRIYMRDATTEISVIVMEIYTFLSQHKWFLVWPTPFAYRKSTMPEYEQNVNNCGSNSCHSYTLFLIPLVFSISS